MINLITIYNYRNIKEANIQINNNISYLVEKNGFGKTNLLESVYYTVFRSSFRSIENYKELIGPFDNSTSVKVEDSYDIGEMQILQNKTTLRKAHLLNSKKVSIKKLIFKFPILVFAPNSVDLVNGSPSIRRSDLDAVLSLIDENYANYIKQYRTVIRNRNSLIKLIKDNKSKVNELDFWTNKLANISTKIQSTRKSYFEQIEEYIKTYGEALFHTVGEINLSYQPNISNGHFLENTLKKYNDNLQKELVVGSTLYGTHKDDYIIHISNNNIKLNARYSGSRGQQRIASFIIKLAQYHFIKEIISSSPIFLIDDIMSELDEKHRQNISNLLIKLNSQLIITGADINEFPADLTKAGRRIKF